MGGGGKRKGEQNIGAWGKRNGRTKMAGKGKGDGTGYTETDKSRKHRMNFSGS